MELPENYHRSSKYIWSLTLITFCATQVTETVAEHINFLRTLRQKGHQLKRRLHQEFLNFVENKINDKNVNGRVNTAGIKGSKLYNVNCITFTTHRQCS